MSETNIPQLCFEEGLTCEACTSSAGRELARACPGLRARMVAQLFVQIYPEPACARSVSIFVAAYKSATGEVEEVLPLRKGVQPETAPARTMTAAA